ncbi:UNVERIFIED_CONTAM: hypothetical protein Sradi_5523500 [Sesamum radiatum]|uniref:Uncharacterized protein n=1 Tax=Sesamum radiatum TaxID=300843 RepID=A0AAW2LCF5_SESRA
MLRLANALHSHKARLTAIPVMGRLRRRAGGNSGCRPAAARQRRRGGAGDGLSFGGGGEAKI